jgi:hypothetical protein
MLGASNEMRTASLREVEQLLDRRIAILRRIMLQDPTRKEWQQELAGAQIALGAALYELHRKPDLPAVKAGLALLTHMAADPHASLSSLDLSVAALLFVEPNSLRNPALAIDEAQHGVQVTRGKSARSFLELAQAYRAGGKQDEGVQAARTGLSLLPDRSGPPANLMTRLKREAMAR